MCPPRPVPMRRRRRRFVPVHRFMGATYVASATSLGVTGLILAPTAYTGLVGSAGFTILDLAMLFTTWTAVRMILAGRYGEHRRSIDPQLLPHHGGSYVAGLDSDLRRACRGRDSSTSPSDGDAAISWLLGPEPAARGLVHQPPSGDESDVSR